jgi:hypothetical protein
MVTALKGIFTGLSGIATCLALIAAIVLGGWQLGWWFTAQNANRQAHVIRQGYSNQQSLREQITQKIGTVEDIGVQLDQPGLDPTTKAQLAAEEKAVLAIVCQDADEVTGDPFPADQAQFISANCLYGNPRN